jgi:LPS-assembly lipoprotein
MSSPDRRSVLVFLALAGCGFVPAEGPGAPGAALRGAVLADPPRTRDGFDFVAAFEDRIGRPRQPRWRLAWTVSTAISPGGITAAGTTTRYTLTGTADFALIALDTAIPVAEGRVEGFTGWFATSTSVAVAAAEADARRRLMTILADRVLARLYAAVAA